MKKVLLTTTIAAAMVASVFAQGSITVSSSSGQMTFTASADGSGATAIPAQGTVNPAQVGTWGALNVALYSATVGTPAPDWGVNGVAIPSTWFAAAPILNKINPTAGFLSTATVTTSASSGAGGASVQAMIVGWTGPFATFNEALAAGTGLVSWSGRFGVGATSWSQGTGGPFLTPPTAAAALVKGAAGFNGLRLAPVPEPTTIALAGLGAAALLIFRRRK